ncbi:hypothetical protein [Roseovarius sp. EL26]|uniref:hypothetical protein n=1 Tax=Roseovarius sp. EL26 TaxID=2126672 RepID=UPI000EA0FA6E|nr:hypothetical protein [Roseovarius sp. EL26]
MFRYIFFHVYEIFAILACILIVGVLIFATRHRLKQGAAEQAQETMPPKGPSQVEMREVGLVSSGMAQTYETRKDHKPKPKMK